MKKFQEAYGVRKAPRTIAQIGLAEQALGRWVAADRHLHEALGVAMDPWIQKNRASIAEALRVISVHIGELDIVGTPGGAEVRVDGELVGRLPLPQPVKANSGGIAVEVRAPGYLAIVRSATVSAGALTRETFNLQPLSPVAEVSTPTVTPADSPASPAADAGRMIVPTGRNDNATESAPRGEGVSPQRVLTYVALGLSAGTLAFALIEHASWQNKVNSFESMATCDRDLATKGGTACLSLYDDGQHAKTLMLVGYSLTGAFALTAAILFLTDSGSSKPQQNMACAPFAVGTGISCAARF
ncbi:MAG: PEGA domain-containing protein [Myxococcales bacterium]